MEEANHSLFFLLVPPELMGKISELLCIVNLRVLRTHTGWFSKQPVPCHSAPLCSQVGYMQSLPAGRKTPSRPG